MHSDKRVCSDHDDDDVIDVSLWDNIVTRKPDSPDFSSLSVKVFISFPFWWLPSISFCILYRIVSFRKFVTNRSDTVLPI